ncbi:MAG: aldo/keto reductase [Devosia sp.]
MFSTSKLGRTNLEVPNLCFGTGGLTNGSDADTPARVRTAQDTVRAILDGPAHFIDTSRIYGRGRSEQRIGEVLRERGGLPPGFILATKLDLDFETRRFDGAAARRSLEASMKALGLDRFHILHLHDPEFVEDITDVTGPRGSLAELMKMKEEGFCGAVGLGAGDVDVMMPLLRDWDFDVMLTHNRFTLVNRNAEAMIDFACSRGIAVLNAAPYGGGVFAKGSAALPQYSYQDAPADVLDGIRKVEAICARHRVPPGAAALQFSMRDPRITATVCGVSKPDRVAETIEWADWPIPAAIWDELATIPVSMDNPQAGRI